LEEQGFNKVTIYLRRWWTFWVRLKLIRVYHIKSCGVTVSHSTFISELLAFIKPAIFSSDNARRLEKIKKSTMTNFTVRIKCLVLIVQSFRRIGRIGIKILRRLELFVQELLRHFHLVWNLDVFFSYRLESCGTFVLPKVLC
jgi:hypothetical protein